MRSKFHKIKFILNPKEFESIFDGLDYYFPITNMRVNIDYQITDKKIIFEKYKDYYNKIISGQEWSKNDFKIEFYASITDKKTYIKYETFTIEEDGKLNKYKRPIILEPVINISPFSLVVDAKDRLSIMFSERDSYIGLEFSYAKIIYGNPTIYTEELSTYQLYLKLIKAIKKNSQKAKVIRNGQISKPNFWISHSCLDEINNSAVLKKENIQLI